jgi:PAS domain S-box-containing protein
MEEVVSVKLENEMDLILAGKRTMKLAELCSLSLTVQTTLATAVSEIARCALSEGKGTVLRLGIISSSPGKKQIIARVCNTAEVCATTEAIGYAKKLIDYVQVIKNGALCDIQLNQDLKFGGLINDVKIQSFIDYFKSEPPLSPYDEIRKKNIQLLEFSDKLRKSEDQYRGLADTLPLMMFLLNPRGELMYTNRWLRDYFGSVLTTLTPIAWRELLHPEDYAGITRDWENILKNRNPFLTQGRLKNKVSGAYLWHMISVVPVKNENNVVTQWTGFFVDIHSQKQVEETLKDNVELKATQKTLVDYQKRLEEKITELNVSNHELEQFAYIASHDLQEPLRKITTFSTLLSDRLKDLDKDSRLYLDKMIASALRMTQLINDVLDWSQLARTSNEFSKVDLNGIIESIRSDYELVIQQKQAVIETSHLPVVKGIKLQMMQLFSNLISNALKFCTRQPVIRITSRDLSQAEIKTNTSLNSTSGYAEVIVSDNGIGFEPEYSEQIFRIFQRLNGRSEYSGTGIGLAICKKIIENHGGIIKATATPGKGAAFSVIIPV